MEKGGFDKSRLGPREYPREYEGGHMERGGYERGRGGYERGGFDRTGYDRGRGGYDRGFVSPSVVYIMMMMMMRENCSI